MFTKTYGGKNEIVEHGNLEKAGEFEGNQTVNNTKQMDGWQPFSNELKGSILISTPL